MMNRIMSASLVSLYLLTSRPGFAEPLQQPRPTQMHHEHGAHHHMGKGHWMAPKKEQKKRNPVRQTAESIEEGKKLYRAHCAGCHGENGEGGGPIASSLKVMPANLKAMASHHSDGDLAWKINEGRGEMPGWRGQLKSKEVWSLVNYLRQLARE